MRIAVTAAGDTLESPVDPRFGRCPYFLIVETDDLSFEPMANPNVSRDSGAGIQAAQFLANAGVQFVITGNCGPNAYQTLTAADIGVIVGCSGDIRRVVEEFKAGHYSTAGQPNVSSHFGMGTAPEPSTDSLPELQPEDNSAVDTGAGPGQGMGQGGGQGMGQGGGRGMGQGGGRGMGGGGGRGMGGGGGRGMGQGGGRGMGQGGGRGMGGGGGRGMGGGGGRGMGGGGGRGMGQGGGRGMGQGGVQAAVRDPAADLQAQTTSQPQPDDSQELDALKAQARVLAAQLQDLEDQVGRVAQSATTPRLVAVVDDQQCLACQQCSEACPAGAITVDAVAVIDTDKCTGCGQCVVVCPPEAVVLKACR